MCNWICRLFRGKPNQNKNDNSVKELSSGVRSPSSQDGAAQNQGQKSVTTSNIQSKKNDAIDKKPKPSAQQIESFYSTRDKSESDKKRSKNEWDRESVTPSEIPDSEMAKTFSLPFEGIRTVQDLMKKEGYEFHTQVGKGGFGIVRKCFKVDPKTGQKRVLAVKEIVLSNNKKERMIRNLKTEIFVLVKCKHPYIIGLEDHFIVHTRSKSMAFLFMEFADGDTLQQEINYGPLSDRVAKRYFAQMATALTYLHRLKIAHKDLKPENILLISNEKTGLKDVRLGDFGLSQNVYKPKEGIIKPGHFGGTRGYMAPEIIRLEVYKQHRKILSLGYDPFKSDMWALGICLFEMLTKNLPFDYHNLNYMLALQEEKNFYYPRSVKDSIDSNADNLIRQLLEPDVAKRIDPLGVLLHPWIKDEVDLSLINVTPNQT